MNKMLSLPLEIVLKSHIIIAEDIQERNIPELYKIVQKDLCTQQPGLSPLDFQSEDHLKCIIQACAVKAQFRVKSSGNCVGFSIAFPAELCRSCRPIAIRGFTVLDPDVKNIGLGQWVSRNVQGWAYSVGFPVSIGRLSISNKPGNEQSVFYG